MLTSKLNGKVRYSFVWNLIVSKPQRRWLIPFDVKGFGPGEGFPDGFIYFAWDLKNPKVKVSAVDYIHFIMEWANAILDDKRIFVEEVDEKFLPELERDIVKPICERILHVYAILFHYHTQNPVHSYDRFYVECAFDRFIYISLYWGLIDFNGETAKYLQEQIDIPRKSYLQEHARDTYIWGNVIP